MVSRLPVRFLGRLGAQAPVLAAVVVVLVVYGWFVTYGTGRFREQESFGSFYDSQALALRRRRLDVDPNSILGEAILHNNRTYGYFGPTPALPRFVLNSLFPQMYGRWSRLSFLAGCFVNLLACWLFLRRVRAQYYASLPQTLSVHLAYGTLLLVSGLGSTNIFLAARPYTYHEAILWGAALALLSYYWLLCYAEKGRTVNLLLAMVACYLSLFSRVSSGAGPALALALTLICRPRRSAHLRMIAGFLVLLAASHLTWTYLKFGSPWNIVPVQMHISYPPARLQAINSTLVHPEDLPFNVKQYFVLPNLRLRRQFPWVYCQDPRGVDHKAVKLDVFEPYAGIPAAMPALFGLSLLGVVKVFRTHGPGWRPVRILILASFLGGAVLFVVAAVSYRYEHDFYPFLVIAAAVGLHEILSLAPGTRRGCAWGAFGAAAVFSIVANLAFAFTYQKDIVWGVPNERRLELTRLERRIDAALHVGSVEPGGP